VLVHYQRVSRIRHVVLFPIRPEVAEEQVEHALASLRGLAALPGVREWRVERSTDTRKGRVLVENGVIDADRFEDFRNSREHEAAAAVLAEIAGTWLVGDYAEDAL
jgi:hypothetical protein